jgi:hypothetical protein
MRSLSIIESSKILKREDLQQLSGLKDELQDVFLNTQIFRTRTEMEASILNDLKHPTPDSKYWQSMREQNVMFHELVMLSYEYRKNQVEIKILEREFVNESDELEKELLQIEIEKKQFIGINQERTAKDRIREIGEWHEIKQELLKDVQYSLEDAGEHQLVSYTIRWIQQLRLLQGNEAPADKINIVGLAKSGIKHCREKGLMYKLYDYFGKGITESIEKSLT